MKKKGTFASIFSFADECRGRMILSVIFAIVSVAGGLIPYLGVYKIILLFFEGTPTTGDILLWSGISAAGYVIKLLFHGISTSFSHISAYKILESIRLALSNKLMRAPLGTVLSQTAGNLKNVIVDRVETIELPLAHMIPEGISRLLLPICVFGYMLFMDWRIALAALACVPIGGGVYAVMMRNYSSQYDKYMKASNHVNSVIIEYTEGIQVIKAFNQSTGSYKKYTDAVKSFKDFTLDWFRSTWGLMNLGNAILPSTLLGVLPAGVLLYLSGALTPAQVTLAIILSMSMIGPVSWFTVAVNDYKSIQYAIKDVNTILDMPELTEVNEPVKLEGYDIKLQEISFAYNDRDGNVLHDLSVTIPQDSFTALVGPSGGGKSTVARLIARFWDVSQGAVTIGGRDIREMPFSQLSDTVSFVSQDNFLFNCSLMENIRLGNPKASDEEVFAAAKAACCDEFIGRFENGWNTSAGEAGGRLSGGERQRIAIARAILKNAPVVILDEATAFTDPENEAQLQASIAALTKGKTLLVIAHRLSTIKEADNIVVLKDGKIEAQGSQQELLQNCPLYQEMWKSHIGARQWSATTDKGEGFSYV
ncbi:ABC transporter ATP-binding protein [Faecalicatena contorta]|uniref:ATP-binding cassette, subfamily B n=1 Tax=Faecalicatena contorta TaxID=39482 RepID=A0A316A2X8_9FIRM|nr:ABC transporter ATP-binding protein [Faecalicatena contorta]PWJ51064.1 ATP-binding cassette subfamily B protein [Faecalicatena contorta]SUQ13632.1 ATP-binding cassette, subfamily B [Faecalicatena contorta]